MHVDRNFGMISHLLPRMSPMSSAPSPRIFVVDDEEVISVTLAAILRRSGFEVTAFTNPLESLAAAFPAQPDLLVSDLMMPGLSGIELAIQMQQVCPKCQILLISGIVGTAHPMVDEMRGHPFELLAKPLEPVVLIHEIRRKLARCTAAA
jgi:DNA-binding NtrC family response regulator